MSQEKIHRFKNCVILRLEIVKNDDKIDLSLNIVYEGSVSQNELLKEVYYTNDTNNIGYLNFIKMQKVIEGGSKTKTKKHIKINDINLSLKPIEFLELFELFELSNSNSNSNRFINNEKNGQYIFYLVRHGQAEHNIMKGLTKTKQSFFGKKDTSLTDQGIKDAIKAGKILQQYTENKNENIDYYFVSDLHRTRETLLNILIGMREVSTYYRLDKYTAYVLNCAHEVVYKNTKCNKTLLPDAAENSQCCTRDEEGNGISTNKSKCGLTNKDCNNIMKANTTLNIKWDYYYQNYRNKKLCQNTNLILQAINIIINKNKNKNIILY